MKTYDVMLFGLSWCNLNNFLRKYFWIPKLDPKPFFFNRLLVSVYDTRWPLKCPKRSNWFFLPSSDNVNCNCRQMAFTMLFFCTSNDEGFNYKKITRRFAFRKTLFWLLYLIHQEMAIKVPSHCFCFHLFFLLFNILFDGPRYDDLLVIEIWVLMLPTWNKWNKIN